MIGKLLPRSRFARDTLTLTMGTTLAQAIPIAISPILTRLFTPADYGVFALYGAIVGLLSVAATGRYELAIMLPDSDADADGLVMLSAMIACGLGLVLLLVMVLFHGQILALLGHPEIGGWLYVMPLSVAAVGIYSALNYWLNRHAKYRIMSMNRALQSALSGGAQLLAGTARVGAGGLIGGALVGQIVTTLQLAIRFWNAPHPGRRRELVGRAKVLAIRYRNHPLHLLPGQWIGAAAYQIPVLAISGLFGIAATGHYSLANRLLVLPTQLVANAMGDVFRQQASEAYRRHESFRGLYLRTLAYSTAFAILPTIIILIIAPDLFAFVFGEPWRIAGEFTRILVISSFFEFVSTPVDKTALIVGATRYIALWHIGRFVALGTAALVGWYFRLRVEQVLALLATANALAFVVDMIITNRLTMLERKSIDPLVDRDPGEG